MVTHYHVNKASLASRFIVRKEFVGIATHDLVGVANNFTHAVLHDRAICCDGLQLRFRFLFDVAHSFIVGKQMVGIRFP